MRPLLGLIVEACGSISCGVYWNYTLRLTERRGEGAYRTLLAYNVPLCYDKLKQCIAVFVDTAGPDFGSESERPTLWPFTPRLTSSALLKGGGLGEGERWTEISAGYIITMKLYLTDSNLLWKLCCKLFFCPNPKKTHLTVRALCDSLPDFVSWCKFGTLLKHWNFHESKTRSLGVNRTLIESLTSHSERVGLKDRFINRIPKLGTLNPTDYVKVSKYITELHARGSNKYHICCGWVVENGVK